MCSFTLRTNTSDQKQSAEPLTAVREEALFGRTVGGTDDIVSADCDNFAVVV